MTLSDFVTSCSSWFASSFMHSISNTPCKGDANICFNRYMQACFINEVIITVVNWDIGLESWTCIFQNKNCPEKEKKNTSLSRPYTPIRTSWRLMLHFNQCFLFWSFLDDFIFNWNIRIVNFFVNCTGLPCSSLPGDLSLTGVTFSVQISSCKRNDYHRLERQSLRLVFSGFVRVLPVHWPWTVSLVWFFFCCFFSTSLSQFMHGW